MILVLAAFLDPETFRGPISIDDPSVEAILRELVPHTEFLGLPPLCLPPPSEDFDRVGEISYIY